MERLHARWRGTFGSRCELVDCKEGLYMGDEHAADDLHLGLPTFGSNVFPQEIPGMRLLSKALDLTENYIETHITRHEPVILPRMF